MPRAAFALLPLLQAAVSLGVGSTLRSVFTYDGAWYYVVARNLAMGRGLRDTVLWQFLAPPPSVVQPAGTYWDVGWPAVLGALMSVLGHSERAALWITEALSGLLPIAVATVAWLATRRALTAWLAGLLVIVQTYLLVTDTVPDVTLAYQLSCLGALAAFHLLRDRPLRPSQWIAGGAALALPSLVRGEGALVLAATVPLLLARPSRVREGWRPAAFVALGIALAELPMAIRNLAVLGHVVPPARTARTWLVFYDQLYAYGAAPTRAAFWAQTREHMIQIREASVRSHLEHLAGVVAWPLLVFAALGAVTHLKSARGDRARALVVPLFLILTLLVPCLGAPLLSAKSRFVRNALPALAVLAAMGVAGVADALARVAPRVARLGPRASRALGAVVVAAAVLASTFLFHEPGRTLRTEYDRLAIYRDTTPAVVAGRSLSLAPDDVVLTDDPWRLAADLDVTTVMCPLNGPRAVEAVVEAYHPRYVVVPTGNRALAKLVATPRFPSREVAKAAGVTWYELLPGGG